MKYVLVSGGVISGIGKGVLASSTGLLLQTIGMKIYPYLNIDAGTMSPMEHGEVFVLDDGGEVDLDLGNYERYLNVTLTRENNLTTGKIYQQIITRERRGDYLGKTVQLTPHLTDGIQEWIERVARIPVDDTHDTPDVCIIELGGTVGDMESAPFIEAMRQLRRRSGKGNFMQIHVSLVPLINNEPKTKPTQAAIREARSIGLIPDLIACRCPRALTAAVTQKIAQYCDVEPYQVLSVTDVDSLYHVPLLLEDQGHIRLLRDILRLDDLTFDPPLVKKGAAKWNAWKTLTLEQERYFHNVNIVLVGKYTDHPDAYHSVIKSLEHAAMACSRKLKTTFVDAEHLEKSTFSSSPATFHQAWHQVYSADGLLVPGGFGTRGTDGMIAAIKSARENNTPFLGICLGMQLAVIEYAQNVCQINQASSAEFNKDTPDPLIVFMPEIDRTTMGATMRLGLRSTHFGPDTEWSKIRALYSKPAPKTPTTNGISTEEAVLNGASASRPTETFEQVINERHRHRYEVNPAYVDRLTEAGLHFIGKDDSGERMEILELKDHRYFVGVQYHPEYLSRVLDPSKPYLGLVAASAGVLPEVMKKRSRTAGAEEESSISI